jgi:hypothetical protein
MANLETYCDQSAFIGRLYFSSIFPLYFFCLPTAAFGGGARSLDASKSSKQLRMT